MLQKNFRICVVGFLAVAALLALPPHAAASVSFTWYGYFGNNWHYWNNWIQVPPEPVLEEPPGADNWAFITFGTPIITGNTVVDNVFVSGQADFEDEEWHFSNPTVVQESGSVSIYNLSVAGQRSPGEGYATGTYELQGGTLTTRHIVHADNGYLYRHGEINQTGGVHANYRIFVGLDGTYTLTDGSLVDHFIEQETYPLILESGGTFAQTGGTNTKEEIEVESGGFYSLSETGVVSSDLQTVGGTFYHRGGSGATNPTNTTDELYVDLGGTYRLWAEGGDTKDPQLTTLGAYVGYDEAGTFYHEGGTHSAATVTIGHASGSQGTYLLSGGSHSATTIYIAAQSGSSGRYELGTNGELDATYVYVGNGGVGTFAQSGGTHDSDHLYVGHNSGGSGRYELTGSGQLEATDLLLGRNGGVGTLSQDGGECETNWMVLGYDSGDSGRYELSSGTAELSCATLGVVGRAGAGTFVQSGGTHTVPTLNIASVSTGSGLYSLTGGSMGATSVYVGRTGTGTFDQTGGTHTVGTLNVSLNAGSTGHYSLSSSGKLNVTTLSRGSGTSSFSFTGGTLVPGTVGFDLTNSGGLLAPGDTGTVGTTTFSSCDYTQTSGTLEIDIYIDPLTSEIDLDTLSIGGAFTAGGTLSIKGLGSRPKEADEFEIITADSVSDSDTFDIILVTESLALGSGGFSATYNVDDVTIQFLGWTGGDANFDHKVSVGDTSILAGNWEQTVYGGYADGDFNGDDYVGIGDMSILAGNWGWELPGGGAVPEPATLSLLCLGGLALIRRKRSE